MRRRVYSLLAWSGLCASLAAFALQGAQSSIDAPEDDMRRQAYEAFEGDAWRRELRFLDAVEPGTRLRATRVPQAEIDRGRWSGEALAHLGGQLFQHLFSREDGLGGRDRPVVTRVQKGPRGGPDARSCATCHWRGGTAGAGDGADNAYLDGDGERLAGTLERNPIALPGAGVLEVLAAEMSRDLAAQRTALLAAARAQGREARAALRTHGVTFGAIVARPDGTTDTREVEGVAPDLVVRPFGWKGNVASVREAVEDALLLHLGLETSYLASHGALERVGPFPRPDPDGDGIIDEIDEGQLTALSLFVALQEAPATLLPRSPDLVMLWARGRSRFESTGCAACHVPSLTLESAVYSLESRSGGQALRVDLSSAGVLPRAAGDGTEAGHRVELFSDLKRHDLGPALSEPRPDRGVSGERFLTRPLWGLARSQPYLHDGRAATIEDAILMHGGEAQAARDGYAALPEEERATLRVFLTSLTRPRRFSVP